MEFLSRRKVVHAWQFAGNARGFTFMLDGVRAVIPSQSERRSALAALTWTPDYPKSSFGGGSDPGVVYVLTHHGAVILRMSDWLLLDMDTKQFSVRSAQQFRNDYEPRHAPAPMDDADRRTQDAADALAYMVHGVDWSQPRATAHVAANTMHTVHNGEPVNDDEPGVVMLWGTYRHNVTLGLYRVLGIGRLQIRSDDERRERHPLDKRRCVVYERQDRYGGLWVRPYREFLERFTEHHGHSIAPEVGSASDDNPGHGPASDAERPERTADIATGRHAYPNPC